MRAAGQDRRPCRCCRHAAKSLAALGFDARIITPYHRVIKEKYASQVTHLTDFYIDLGWRHQYVGIERLLLDGIVIYLVDNEFYFGDRIYRGGEAEGEQYAFFARVILEALPRLDFTPEILHCNDWHTAVLPMLMKTQYAGRMQSRMQTLLTIHNIAYQGKFSFEFVQDLLGIDARYYTPEFMELNGCANLLKAGCVFADHINTVSPSYAGEIRTAAYGERARGDSQRPAAPAVRHSQRHRHRRL
ncbi:MAG: glycogen synthase [Oscillospiraceae bacterium]